MEPEPIMTDEKFENRILGDGTTEFVYGISWRNTSQESLLDNNDRQEERSPPRRGERNEFEPKHERFAIQADNKTKLELEDKAAEGLNKRLRKEKLCADGHLIDDVMWRDDNIRLLGHCLYPKSLELHGGGK
jgi:hypothetical protein